MAVPSSPSVASRGLYFPFAVPAPNFPTANAPGGGSFTQPNPSSVFPPDIPGASPGVGLPMIVLSVGGSSPDFQGSVFLVHAPDGSIVKRSALFASGQPLLSVATWTTNGSNPLQARWSLVDTTT
jgi:hypothetical protein